MNFKQVGFARAALTALAMCAPSGAAIIDQFTSSSVFLAANPGLTFMDFSRASGTLAFASGTNTLTVPSFTPTFQGFYNESATSASSTLWINGTTVYPQFNFGSGGVMMGGANSANGTAAMNTGLKVNFSAGTRAVGFSYAAVYGESAPYVYPTSGNLQLRVIETGNVASFVNLALPGTAQTLGYFALTTSTDIVRIELVGNFPTNRADGRTVVDNLSFGAAAAAPGGGEVGTGELPEPQTYAISAAGLLGLVVLSRRLKN
jgi:hypothetical protein